MFGKLIKSVDRNVLEHNQHHLTQWGQAATDGGAKAMMLISAIDNGQVMITAVDNRSPEDIALILETTAQQLRAKNNNSLHTGL